MVSTMDEATRKALTAHKAHCHAMLRKVRGILQSNPDLPPEQKRALGICADHWQQRLGACQTLLGLRTMTFEWNGEPL